MKLDSQTLYTQLGLLVQTMPDLMNAPMSSDLLQWLGRAYALVRELDPSAAIGLQFASDNLHTRATRPIHAHTITATIYRALAQAELSAPATAQGAFIPVGGSFDAFAAIGKVLQRARRDALIVDPYMDERALTDFAPLISEGVTIRLLADQKMSKPSLPPAVARWLSQYGSARPLEARLAPPHTLHDRLLIIDNVEPWTLTQSLNAFAARSPATIVRVDGETAALKIAAYDELWRLANPLSAGA